MILFTLRCANDHEFEGWFRDSDGFDAQRAAGEIACPHCGDSSVEKGVMAPRLARSREAMPPAVALAQMRKALTEMRRRSKIIATTSAPALPRRRAASIMAKPIRAEFMARRQTTSRAN
jgi:hypothetical protein